MLKRIFVTLTLSSLLTTSAYLLSLNFTKAIAQEISETTPSKPETSITTVISPDKRTLIKELLEITESSKNANQVMESMVRSELPKMVSTILKAVPALNSDRPEVQKQFSDIVSRMAVKYRDRVIKQIDINQLIEQVSYPIYDKYFTESELRDIIGFYKSPTGKKAINVLPQIMVDSMSRTNDILLPKMSRIMTEIISEELLNTLPKQK
ncbi:MAG: DUF2059 domain-containing protein [Pseudanabaena sp. M57BS1SP1A06MG]|nr:DUF2059 domain-containing protein [Pseudanabaena sp. M53BS1SP1A06MG]MCA6583902.1 DUF2059 domain-containing protein [Pseudanabaena sp. M34BS1SP1A06MG]MCA6592454.1 DUF2059 domain-containing protein [Pseudanabaena sp. M38BS1SP1A06MG]MCA6600153.1 DUF2059 domain-containing protein [Pseudanabaena sp. M57BS1SP1A06MG]